MAAKKQQEIHIDIKAPVFKRIEVGIKGDVMLVHNFSEKARKEILDGMMNKQKSKNSDREPKNPDREFVDSLYWLDPPEPPKDTEKALDMIAKNKVTFGIPVMAVKKAMVSACRYTNGGLDMTKARGLFKVCGSTINPERLELEAKKLSKRQDMVRLPMGKPDVRFRGEFKDWYVKFTVEFEDNIINETSIINLLAIAGRMVGLCENRPEKGGTLGTFEVDQKSVKISRVS